MPSLAICFERLEYRIAPFAQVDIKPKRGETFFNPFTATDDERREMLAKIASNEVLSIKFLARTFGDRPNANMRRPEPGQIGKLAKQASGNPFQRDHRMATAFNLGGVDRGIVKQAEDGVDELFEVIEIEDPQGMEDFVRRKMKEFSISMAYESAYCSFCGTAAWKGYLAPYLDCSCSLGTMQKDEKTGEKRLVEILMRGVQKRETSHVTIGAYQDTAVFEAFQAANRNRAAFFSIANFNPDLGEETTKMPNGKGPEGTQGAPEKDQDNTAVAQYAKAVKRAEDAEKERDALKAKLTAAFQERDHALGQAFKMAFDHGVRTMKFTPTDEDEQRVIFLHVHKKDITSYMERVNGRDKLAQFNTEPKGAAADPVRTEGEPEPSEDSDKFDFSMEEKYRSELSQEQIDAAVGDISWLS